MYLHGKGLANWYITTPVVSVNESEGKTMKSIL